MNARQISILILVVFLAGSLGFLAGTWNREGPTQTNAEMQSEARRDSTELDSEGREILYWQAPMNPSEIYDQPGKSAMGMDLVPVYADQQPASDESAIRIDPVTVQNMGVRTARVSRTDFSRMIRTVGEVKYDEERIFEVNSRTAGWIETLFVNFIGEYVQKGDPLLEIYSPELVTTQEEYLLARRNLEFAIRGGDKSVIADARRLLASSLKRLQNWDIPSEEIRRLEESSEVSRTVLLRTPETGIVTEKNVVDGAHITAGADLFQIADLRTVWVHTSFFENEVPWIQQGQPVEMELSYLPGKIYRGTVSYIYPYLREKARDVHVRLIFQNPDLELKPGMYANVQLQGKVIPDAVVVPTEAVIHSGERTLVFVVKGDGLFEPREIKEGEEGGPGNGLVRVMSGLQEGEEIVVSAQFMLDSESRLQEAIRKMLEIPGKGGMNHQGMAMPGDSAAQSGMQMPGDSAAQSGMQMPGDSAAQSGMQMPPDAHEHDPLPMQMPASSDSAAAHDMYMDSPSASSASDEDERTPPGRQRPRL